MWRYVLLGAIPSICGFGAAGKLGPIWAVFGRLAVNATLLLRSETRFISTFFTMMHLPKLIPVKTDPFCASHFPHLVLNWGLAS